MMRFATLSLTLLLTTGLMATGRLYAQAGNPDAPQNMDNAQSGEEGQDPAGDAGLKAGSVQDFQAMGLHGIDVEVRQDPIRIAPGEHGHLILLVHLPKGRTAEKGGQVVMSPTQGPLKLGMAVWDPPAKGKNVYSDVIVIKVPLSIDAKAPFGKPIFQGSVRLRGDFHVSAQPGAEIVADGGQPAPETGPDGRRLTLDPGRAELRFQSPVHIGPPMPKSSRSRKQAGNSSGTRARSVKSGSGKGQPTGAGTAKAGPADGVPAAGKARTGSRADPDAENGAGEEAPELADKTESGFPWWILSIALVLFAALSFAMQSKKS